MSEHFVAAERRVLRVSELLGQLRELLDDRVGRAWVVGEVSNLRRAASGHVYFTLKDEAAQIRAALFRSAAQRLPFELEEGLEVVVYGDVTVYETRGDLQLIVRQMEPRGQGALQLAFEQLRRRLEGEGLFDAARKRALPAIPRRVGVVTSEGAAALRDVIQVTGRRFPSIPLLLSPSRVQGEGAEREIAAALERVCACEDVDVVLLVRGGGSLEDLQPFNTELLARALAAAPLPVVSGVGHEVDVTIADLVADARAPTPSAAAALVVPDRSALGSQLQRDWRRLCIGVDAVLERAAARLARRHDALRVLAPSARIAAHRARLAAGSRGLQRAAGALSARLEARLAELAGRLHELSPLAVLARGYALVRRASDGAIVRRADQLAAGDSLSIRVAEAEIDAAVSAARPLRDR